MLTFLTVRLRPMGTLKDSPARTLAGLARTFASTTGAGVGVVVGVGVVGVVVAGWSSGRLLGGSSSLVDDPVAVQGGGHLGAVDVELVATGAQRELRDGHAVALVHALERHTRHVLEPVDLACDRQVERGRVFAGTVVAKELIVPSCAFQADSMRP